MARMSSNQTKSFAVIDSNVIVYALIKDYPDKELHEKCLKLMEMGLKGELGYILAVNPIIIVEVFSVLRKLLNCKEAEQKTNSLVSSLHLGFLTISKQACKTAIEWAMEKNIPVNDAVIAACMMEYAGLIYTVDEDHFKKLKEYNVEILNPAKSPF